MGRSFTGEEFHRALASDSLTLTAPLIGMVKAADEPDAIRFAPGTACKNWTAIPVTLIERVETLSQVPCDDHVHHLVRLQLKDSDTPEAAALGSLLRAVLELRGSRQPAPQERTGQPTAGRWLPRQGAHRSERSVAAGCPPPPGPCADGDTCCSPTTGCWGCCGGVWDSAAAHGMPECEFGMRFQCGERVYDAINCWPIG